MPLPLSDARDRLRLWAALAVAAMVCLMSLPARSTLSWRYFLALEDPKQELQARAGVSLRIPVAFAGRAKAVRGARTESAALPDNDKRTVSTAVIRDSDYLLVTWLCYPNETAVPPLFSLFLQSAAVSSADVVVFSIIPLVEHKLPGKVKLVVVSWNDLVKRVEQVLVPDGPVQLQGLMVDRADYTDGHFGSKANDIKPLTAALFPEVVAGYKYWGYCDNDAALGDVAGAMAAFTHLPPRALSRPFMENGTFSPPNRSRWRNKISTSATDLMGWLPTAACSGDGEGPCDVVSLYGRPKLGAFHMSGPFALYRNTPLVNSIYQQLPRDHLVGIFNTTSNRRFDEQGPMQGGRAAALSMTHAVRLAVGAHSLRYNRREPLGSQWDGLRRCAARCACMLDSRGQLWLWERSDPNVTKQLKSGAFFCHYEKRKVDLNYQLRYGPRSCQVMGVGCRSAIPVLMDANAVRNKAAAAKARGVPEPWTLPEEYRFSPRSYVRAKQKPKPHVAHAILAFAKAGAIWSKDGIFAVSEEARVAAKP